MARINAVSFHEDPSIESICRKVVAAGFDSLEMSRPPFYDKLRSESTRRRFAEWARELGLSLFGFDCWVEVEPYEEFQATLAEFSAAIDWAVDLDLGMIITHDPWAKTNADRSPSECLRVNLELFQRVADLCEAKGLRLVFEPHPDTLSMNNSWGIELIDRLGRGRPHGSAGILYDSCHYGVGQPESYVEAIGVLGERITHVHFADGDARTYALHLPFGDGDLNLEAVTAALERIEYRGTLTNDLFNYPLLEDGARRNVEGVRELERRLGLSEPRGGPS